MKKKALIIGAGIGGLAVACRLVARGFDVELLEKRDRVGGKASCIEINGFKFDSGLSVVTAPFMLDDLFSEGGKKRSEYIHLIPIDPTYRIFHPDGRSIIKYQDSTRVVSQIERLNPADKLGFHRYLYRSQQMFKKYFAPVATKPVDLLQTIRLITHLYRNNDQISVFDQVSKYFNDDFLRQAFSILPLSIGGNPFSLPSFFTMFHYMEKEWGYYYPLGGAGALVNGMKRLFEELGGTLLLNSEVEEIIFQGNKAVGARLKDKSIRYADIIVAAIDTPFLYKNLIPADNRSFFQDWQIQRYDLSNSYFSLFLGVRRRYLDRGLMHNNVHMARNFKGICENIFKKKKLSDDLCLFISMPTFSDTTIAPPSHEIFHVLTPVPNLTANIHWEKIARSYRDRILQILENTYFPDLRSNIVVEHYIAPPYYQEELNSYMGAGCSMQPTIFQSGWFRPHNKALGLENLYLVGEGSHPGPGLPGVLLSAKITAEMI